MSAAAEPDDAPRTLRRELGLAGATALGMGSILGTGVFVSLGLAAGVAGGGALIAIVLAAGVATCNGLNSAQLAASHPVSGGTYEYGYVYAHPRIGFVAGWTFLCAKSASAATAALGFAGYLLEALGADPRFRVPVALAAAAALTGVVLAGMRPSKLVNFVAVGIAIASLAFFVLAGLPRALERGPENWRWGAGTPAVLHATALLFVAYTGYGRIATLGEEVREPERTIPRAVVLTLALAMALYVAVAAVAIGAAGPRALAEATRQEAAPLEVVARTFGAPGAGAILAVGATTAMLAVLLNLLLGLSRVLLAMGRRGDMPAATARLDSTGTTPYVAVLAVAAVIALEVLVGDVRATWSFSAFTVLVYYAITNLCALRLPPHLRRYPRALAWIGLAACLFLAFQVERAIWLTGLGLVALGLVWQEFAFRLRPRSG